MVKSRICLLLLLWLLLVVVLVPVRAQNWDWDLGLGAMLTLTNAVANLGELKTDPLNPLFEYFEAENAISFSVFVLFREWQVLLSGTDFVSGVERIPLEQLEWKMRDGTYRRMPAPGRNQEIMRVSGIGLYSGNLSFRLVLAGDERPGLYNSTITLTLVNP